MQFELRRLDIYRKIPKDLTQSTLTGAVISVCCMLFITYLIIAELIAYLVPEITNTLIVSDPRNFTERIPVNLQIAIFNMECKFINLDIQDENGRHEVGMIKDASKEAINDERGCLFNAQFEINKVPGNFHVSTHSSSEQPEKPDMAHEIKHLTIGTSVSRLEGWLPVTTAFKSLDGVSKRGENDMSSYEYHLRIVPSVFETTWNKQYFPYQFTYAYKEYVSFGHGGLQMPAIWFRYDLTPITVYYKEHRKPFYHFLTTICAIVGGTFTVAGIIDSLVFSASEIVRKFEIGKQS